MDRKKQIYEAVLELCYEQPQGALFVINEKANSRYYKHEEIVRKYDKSHKKFVNLNVLDKFDNKLIRRIAPIDGAIIVNNKGYVEAINATLKHSKRFKGHGTRHEFALGTSAKYKDLTCILASEEDRHIRVFKAGVLLLDIDARTKLPVKTENKVVGFLTSKTTATIIAGGIAASLLTLNPIPALITIAGSSIVVTKGFEEIKKLLR